jgi:hypothetical protein
VEAEMVKNGWTLVDVNGDLAVVGEVYETFRGEFVELRDATPPQTGTSTGRVYVMEALAQFERGYYPSVCGLKWFQE